MTATLARNATIITANVTYTNAIGMSATLRFDSQGGYVPGLGPQGVWFVDHTAPYFPQGLVAEMAHNRDRSRAERALRNWLRQTAFPEPIN